MQDGWKTRNTIVLCLGAKTIRSRYVTILSINHQEFLDAELVRLNRFFSTEKNRVFM